MFPNGDYKIIVFILQRSNVSVASIVSESSIIASKGLNHPQSMFIECVDFDFADAIAILYYGL